MDAEVHELPRELRPRSRSGLITHGCVHLDALQGGVQLSFRSERQRLESPGDSLLRQQSLGAAVVQHLCGVDKVSLGAFVWFNGSDNPERLRPTVPPGKARGMTSPDADFSDLKATFLNCTLKKSPALSHTEGLIDASANLMRKHGVDVDVIRPIDHDIAIGVYPDMKEQGWEKDAWPDLYPGILDSDILVIGGPIWLGDNSSVTKIIIERLYALSGMLNDEGQSIFYGRVAGCLITGNEDGIKHCAMNILYSLGHVGYTIPPQADAGWIGEAGPGPSYLDEGSGGPENDFTNRNATFMTWNLMHMAQALKASGGIPAYGNVRPAWSDGERFDWENPEYRS